MAFDSKTWRSKRMPVVIIIGYRNEKSFAKYGKGIERDDARACSSSKSRRLVLIRARIQLKNCRPRVKESENVGAWRKKSTSKSKNYPQRSSSTPPRPTLLLPPMHGPSVPVVTTRVQNTTQCFLHLDHLNSESQSIQPPSAPSPGHLFYNSEDHSDITFIVGREEWRFPAHSFIIGKTRSTLTALLKTANFEEIISGVDISNDTPIVLKLPNLQPEVFEQILRYIYTGQVTFLTLDSTLRLLNPSRIYHLPHLTSHCLSHISKHVNAANVLTVLSHLLCYPTTPTEETNTDSDNERNELVFKCFLLIDRHADEVLQSELFETLEHELMIEIVKRDTLQVSSETVIFESVMRWACRACKKQRKELTSENKCSVLGKAIYLVRYLTMSPEEFLRGPVSHGVLNKEDKEVLLARLNTDSQAVLPEKWSGWKIAERRNKHPSPDLTSAQELVVSPSNSVQPVSNTKDSDRKKKSMSKKFLNGVGDLVICVIQLLD